MRKSSEVSPEMVYPCLDGGRKQGGYFEWHKRKEIQTLERDLTTIS